MSFGGAGFDRPGTELEALRAFKLGSRGRRERPAEAEVVAGAGPGAGAGAGAGPRAKGQGQGQGQEVVVEEAQKPEMVAERGRSVPVVALS